MKQKRFWFWARVRGPARGVHPGRPRARSARSSCRRGRRANCARSRYPTASRREHRSAARRRRPEYNSWGLRDREHPLQKPAGPPAPCWSATASSKAPSSRSRSARGSSAIWQVGGPSRLGSGEPRHLGDGAAAILLPHPQHRSVAAARCARADGLRRQRCSCPMPCRRGACPPPIAERPRPSWLRSVAPRLTWLLVNRLGLSEFGRANRPRPTRFRRS